jgi:hypothetical protein
VSGLLPHNDGLRDAPGLGLEELRAELREARTCVSEERGAVRQFSVMTPAREALLAALEAYAAGLTTAGQPLPYRLRDELFLHRRLAQSSVRPGSSD